MYKRVNQKEIKNNKYKKGFIFTVDAIFSLIILGIAISALVYFFYESNLASQTVQLSASSAMQSMLFYKIGNLSESKFASAMFLPQLQNNTWPQYGGNSTLSFSTSADGPALPLVMFTFHAPNPINPNPVVADGMVVFTTEGPSSQLYALNATTGNLLFSTTAPSGNFIGTPLIFMHNIYAATTSGNIYAYLENGIQLWQQTIGTSYVILNAEDGYIDANSTLLNPFNGIIITSASTKAPSLFSDGEFLQYGLYSPSSGSWEGALQSYTYYHGSSLISTWHVYNTPLASSESPAQPPSLSNKYLNTEFLNCIYIYNLGGALISNKCLNKPIIGSASILNNKTYIQTSNNIYSLFDNTSNIYFNESLPIISTFNSTPSSAQNLIYTLLNGNTLVAFNHDGIIEWQVTFKGTPIQSFVSDIPIAYGNIYLPVGRNLYAIGAPKANPQSNLLNVLASLYLNKKGSYADALLSEALKGNESSEIFINNTYAPSLDVAYFNGYNANALVSYFNEPNPLNIFSISFWINPTAQQNSNPTIMALGPASSNNYRISISTTGAFQSAPLTFSYVDPSGVAHSVSSGFNIPSNAYSFITLTFNSGTLDWYLNSSLETTYINMNSIGITNNTLDIGENFTAYQYNGVITGIQIYNSLLTKKQIYNLYEKGIASTPISNSISSSIEGWWPMQGDTNDYANFHFTYPYNIIYKNVSFAPYNFKSAYLVSTSAIPLSIDINGSEKTFNVGVVEWR